jgi:hypothetical protein
LDSFTSFILYFTDLPLYCRLPFSISIWYLGGVRTFESLTTCSTNNFHFLTPLPIWRRSSSTNFLSYIIAGRMFCTSVFPHFSYILLCILTDLLCMYHSPNFDPITDAPPSTKASTTDTTLLPPFNYQYLLHTLWVSIWCSSIWMVCCFSYFVPLFGSPPPYGALPSYGVHP